MKVSLCLLSLSLLLFVLSCNKQQKQPLQPGTQEQQAQIPTSADPCALTPPVCSITNNECDYNIDLGTKMGVSLDHSKGENIHFHAKKQFGVTIVPDQNAPAICRQDCDTCPFHDNSSQTSDPCKVEDIKNVVFQHLTTNYPGHSCRYRIDIGITQPPKDPNLIVH